MKPSFATQTCSARLSRALAVVLFGGHLVAAKKIRGVDGAGGGYSRDLSNAGYSVPDHQWCKRVQDAQQDVVRDASLHQHRRTNPVLPEANFRAIYTVSSYRGIRSLTSTGFLKVQHQPTTETTSLLSTCQGSSACPTISGSGRYGDKGFTIVRGAISPFSGKCYWVEESNHSLRQVLITGTFAFSSDLPSPHFQGRWQSQNGEYGFTSRFDVFPMDFDANDDGEGPSVVPAIAMPAADAVSLSGSECGSMVQVEANMVDVLDDCEAGATGISISSPEAETMGDNSDSSYRTCYEELPFVADTAPHFPAATYLEYLGELAQQPAATPRSGMSYRDQIWWSLQNLAS